MPVLPRVPSSSSQTPSGQGVPDAPPTTTGVSPVAAPEPITVASDVMQAPGDGPTGPELHVVYSPVLAPPPPVIAPPTTLFPQGWPVPPPPPDELGTPPPAQMPTIPPPGVMEQMFRTIALSHLQFMADALERATGEQPDEAAIWSDSDDEPLPDLPAQPGGDAHLHHVEDDGTTIMHFLIGLPPMAALPWAVDEPHAMHDAPGSARMPRSFADVVRALRDPLDAAIQASLASQAADRKRRILSEQRNSIAALAQLVTALRDRPDAAVPTGGLTRSDIDISDASIFYKLPALLLTRYLPELCAQDGALPNLPLFAASNQQVISASAPDERYPCPLPAIHALLLTEYAGDAGALGAALPDLVEQIAASVEADIEHAPPFIKKVAQALLQAAHQLDGAVLAEVLGAVWHKLGLSEDAAGAVSPEAE